MNELHRIKNSNWFQGTLEGHWLQALIFDEPSKYGINGGRISKLFILEAEKRVHNKSFNDQCSYIYERGLEKDDIDPETFAVIVAALETC